MKNILLILTGGTICTEINQKGRLDVTEKAKTAIIQSFLDSSSPYKNTVRFTPTENLGILSENMSVNGYNIIIDTYKRYIKSQAYDGVIIAHGTDTLAFSTSLFSMLLHNTDIPVLFVSANKRISDESSNAADNFRYAAECIAMGITPGVYAVYKNISDQKVYLHLASRLEQCKNYSEDFYSMGAVDITDIDMQNCKGYFDLVNKGTKSQKAYLNINNVRLSDCVLCITPYVGINYSAIDYSRFSAVLHGTYHSGTVCAEGENSVFLMIDRALSAGADVYFSPSRLCGEIYESLGKVGEYAGLNKDRISFLYGTTIETAYAKLLVAYSCLDDKDKIKEFLSDEINCEKIHL
ncbi:MAG: asparaginase [Clostridia bacterium]|nr:asparaginase [Clostridia bacterium]